MIKGSQNVVGAPATETIGGTSYPYGSWSDGGNPCPHVKVDEDTSLTAVYGPPSSPTITDVTPASPANDNNPVIKGTVGPDFPTAVKIFDHPGCDGSVAATLTPEEFEAGVALPVPDDETTYFGAATANSADNSLCSNQVAYTEDSTAPAAPTGLASDPTGPSSETHPMISGQAEDGSTVRVYAAPTAADCIPANLLATGNATEFTTPGLEVTVPPNADTVLRASATDPAGNASPCSDPITYSGDLTPPDAPTGLASDPAGPAAQTHPKVTGQAEAGSTVRVYAAATAADCVPANLLATGSAAQFASPGLEVTVPANADTVLRASADIAGSASACSDPITYSEDSMPPGAPTALASDPTGPSSETHPKISGQAEAGSTVRVYAAATTADCIPANLLATGSAAQFASPGLEVTVPANLNTVLRATATDLPGNTSACSAPIAYTEDSTAPAAPTGLATDPAGPAAQVHPKVRGSVEADATVRIYAAATAADCVPANLLATGGIAQFASPGLEVTVPANADTVLRASATDLAGNTSACSDPITYTEDSSAPETTITKGPPAKLSMARTRRHGRPATPPRASFSFSSSDPQAHFLCRLDKAEFASCQPPAVYRNFKRGHHTFAVVAVDAAGNVDPTPATRSFNLVIKKKKKKR